MKRVLMSAIAAAVLAAVWLAGQNARTPKPLADITPAGVTLYLEAKNFNSLWNEWNNSQEKRTWLGSENYETFSRSRLFLRLKDAFQEYAGATGVPPDTNLLSSVAGGATALAMYDINKLEFLFLTRIANARAMDSLLYKAREKFESRNAAGQAYYVRTDAASGRTAAFAIAGDLLLIATREDALSGALGLLQGNGSAVSREPWFDRAVKASGAAGDVRMVYSMERLLRSPGFRSYWIQGNLDSLRPFQAGINDLVRPAGEVREERVLLREQAGAAPDTSAMGELLRFTGAGNAYRAAVSLEPAQVLDWVSGQVLYRTSGNGPASKSAPGAAADTAQPGSESDLDTRIDAAPFEAEGMAYRPQALTALLAANAPRGAITVGASRTQADNVFVQSDEAVVILGSSPWDGGAVRNAIGEALAGLYTTRRIGLGWRDEGQGVWQIDGLAPVAVSTQGPLLLISNRTAFLKQVLQQSAGQAQTFDAVYVSGFLPTNELAAYTRMMRLIEFPQGAGDGPPFFSANLASIGRTLGRVREVSLIARDDGAQLKQTVRYRLGQ